MYISAHWFPVSFCAIATLENVPDYLFAFFDTPNASHHLSFQVRTQVVDDTTNVRNKRQCPNLLILIIVPMNYCPMFPITLTV